jgi:hypothetical protein
VKRLPVFLIFATLLVASLFAWRVEQNGPMHGWPETLPTPAAQTQPDERLAVIATGVKSPEEVLRWLKPLGASIALARVDHPPAPCLWHFDLDVPEAEAAEDSALLRDVYDALKGGSDGDWNVRFFDFGDGQVRVVAWSRSREDVKTVEARIAPLWRTALAASFIDAGLPADEVSAAVEEAVEEKPWTILPEPDPPGRR